MRQCNGVTGDWDPERSITLFRPALLEGRNFHSFCLVRSISAAGMIAQIDSQMTDGEKIKIKFAEAVGVSGRVVANTDDKFSVEFDAPIDVGSLLDELAGDTSRRVRYRSPRLDIDAPARLVSEGQTHQVQVKDISQRGMKVEASWAPIRLDQEGIAVLPGLKPRKSVVRWRRAELAGLLFLEPIDFSELGQWVLGYHHRHRAE